jgi:pSer/pThr/pTyr-binding forkhead associated (FHA) protein
MTWQLIAQSEPSIAKSMLIDRDMLIGRHPQADIVLQAMHISRRHAALWIKDGQLWIEDLASAQGTYVNGQKIIHRQALQHLDEIEFQNIRFVVHHQVETLLEPAAPRALADAQHLSLETSGAEDQGMPTLAQRGSKVEIQADGMPARVSIPKPAPIPDHVQLELGSAAKAVLAAESAPPRLPTEQQKNLKVGVIAVLLLLLVAFSIGFYLL